MNPVCSDDHFYHVWNDSGEHCLRCGIKTGFAESRGMLRVERLEDAQSASALRGSTRPVGLRDRPASAAVPSHPDDSSYAASVRSPSDLEALLDLPEFLRRRPSDDPA